jgi:Mn2+/Fe2+ NRAMP family transporter
VFTASADRRSVLDRAHRGDVVGALGRIPSHDTAPRKSFRGHAAALLAVMGPGVIVLVADNDAGGISTYAQAGQDYGLRFLWLLLVLVGVLLVNQEMVGRLGAVTGAGHARLIYERFGRGWGAFALGDLLAVNFLVIITDFTGVGFGLGYFGVSRYLSVPLAALALIALPVGGSFRRWERAVYVLVAASLAAVPLAIIAHHLGPLPALPAARRAPPGGTAFVVIAMIGSTVTPWQLFFQQSNVVDKRITARWLGYERADTVIGMLLFTVVGVAVLTACALAFSGTSWHGAVTDTGMIAAGLGRGSGWAGALFAVVLSNGSVLGAGAVTLSSSYAIGDVFGTRHSLHRPWREARVFHGSYAALVALAALVTLVPGVPFGIVATGVQALAGVLLPSALVFLLLLCNDPAVLGPWVNPRWLNIIAAAVTATILVLFALLIIGTLFSHLTISWRATALVLLAAAILGAALGTRLSPDGQPGPPRSSRLGPPAWTMPPIETLPPPAASRARTLGLIALRAYLILAAAVVIIKIARVL